VTSDQVTRKEGNPHKGIDWPTHETSGRAKRASPRKEGRRAGYRGTGANKRPLGDS
jgi:hypothetical protein